MLNKKIKNNIKSEKAITLIALVITVIVLLILAGISISMLSGDNSILNKAGQARDMTGEKSVAERIQIAYLGAMTNGEGSFSRDKFVDELDKTFGEGKYTLSTDGSTLTIDGKDYETGLPGKWSKEEKTAMTSNNITEVTGNDIANANLKDENKIKAVIKDEDNAQIPIPVDAEYVEGKESTGVVIKYKDSEFVWVPVPVTTTNSLYPKGTNKAMAKVSTTKGVSGTDSNGRINYEGILYDFLSVNWSPSGTTFNVYNTSQETSRIGEPEIISEFDNDTETYLAEINLTQSTFKKEMQENYNAMIESVAKYGGFFVGRYETSIDSKTIVASKLGTPMSAMTDNQMWYGMYDKQKKFTRNSDVMQSSMIWGSQYDAMLNWMQEGEESSKVNAITNGNHSLIATTTGGTKTDVINNIFDLEGNMIEWTLEANSICRQGRGVYVVGNAGPASVRGDGAMPNGMIEFVGSRMSLYIKYDI